ncbi:MAG: hypothetical protein V3R87_11830 [Dehalococcoidia bacterium]
MGRTAFLLTGVKVRPVRWGRPAKLALALCPLLVASPTLAASAQPGTAVVLRGGSAQAIDFGE